MGVVKVGAPSEGLEATNPNTLDDVGVFKRFKVPGVNRVGGSSKLPGLSPVDANVGVVSIKDPPVPTPPLKLFSNDNRSPSRFPDPNPKPCGTDRGGLLISLLGSLIEVVFDFIKRVASLL